MERRKKIVNTLSFVTSWECDYSFHFAFNPLLLLSYLILLFLQTLDLKLKYIKIYSRTVDVSPWKSWQRMFILVFINSEQRMANDDNVVRRAVSQIMMMMCNPGWQWCWHDTRQYHTVETNDPTIGWQYLNLLSHPNATIVPQARQARPSDENLNYLLSR